MLTKALLLSNLHMKTSEKIEVEGCGKGWSWENKAEKLSGQPCNTYPILKKTYTLRPKELFDRDTKIYRLEYLFTALFGVVKQQKGQN